MHVVDPNDLMTTAPEATQTFSDATFVTLDNECGRTEQNAHVALLATLGRRTE